MLCSKAQAIDELESTIPAWVEACFPGLFPPYLHVLRADPDKLDAVKWVGAGCGMGCGGGGGGGGGRRLRGWGGAREARGGWGCWQQW